jgi:hypothetical protein
MVDNCIMVRTRISLATPERQLLDTEAERTVRSISALIRHAVTEVYGPNLDAESDMRAIKAAFGSWNRHVDDGETTVNRFRSGARPECSVL